jgi:ketosteroid isomerase-like protein
MSGEDRLTDGFDPIRATKIIEAYNRAWNDGDLNKLSSFWTDDFIQWHCNIRRNFTREEELALLRTVVKVSKITFTKQVRTPLDQAVLDRHLIDIVFPNGKQALGIPCSVIFFFRGDKIYRSEEYVDGLSVPFMDILPEPAITGQTSVVDGGITCHFPHVADKRAAFEDGRRPRTEAATRDWHIPASSILAGRWETICRSALPGALVAILDEKAVVFTNYDKRQRSVEQYKADASAAGRLLAGARFKDFRILYQPNGFVGLATMERDTASGMVSTPFCVVADIVGERIVRFEEYLDATTLQ